MPRADAGERGSSACGQRPAAPDPADWGGSGRRSRGAKTAWVRLSSAYSLGSFFLSRQSLGAGRACGRGLRLLLQRRHVGPELFERPLLVGGKPCKRRRVTDADQVGVLVQAVIAEPSAPSIGRGVARREPPGGDVQV